MTVCPRHHDFFGTRWRRDHKHNELCDQCQALNGSLREVGEAAQDAEFRNEDERDEILFLYESAKRSIQAWKAHQLRSVQQDKSRMDVLQLLNDNTVLIVNDWAMKFLPSCTGNPSKIGSGRGEFPGTSLLFFEEKVRNSSPRRSSTLVSLVVRTALP